MADHHTLNTFITSSPKWLMSFRVQGVMPGRRLIRGVENWLIEEVWSQQAVGPLQVEGRLGMTVTAASVLAS
jgi:hypothetical protein